MLLAACLSNETTSDEHSASVLFQRTVLDKRRRDPQQPRERMPRGALTAAAPVPPRVGPGGAGGLENKAKPFRDTAGWVGTSERCPKGLWKC